MPREAAYNRRSHLLKPLAERTGLLHLPHACGRNRSTHRVEKLAQRVPVEELLVRPATEKAGGLSVFDRACVQDCAQINDGVRLDVAHASQRSDFLVRDGVPRRIRKIEVTDVSLPGIADVRIYIEVKRGLGVIGHGRR